MQLLRSEFESDNITKSKAVKYIVKQILPDYEQLFLIFINQNYGKQFVTIY